MLIAFPPCTHLCVSGARHFAKKKESGVQQEALDFVSLLWNSGIPKIAIENPVGILSTKMQKPTQIIQPYYFGDAVTKKTCLWLKGLSPLVKTNEVVPEKQTTSKGTTYDKWWLYTSSLPLSIRGHIRSKTFPGIAKAMADQWG